MRLAFIIVSLLGLLVKTDYATAADWSKFTKDRLWQFTVGEDPFNGRTPKILGLAFQGDNPASGLLAITLDGSTVMLSLTDTSQYFCPDIDLSGDLNVSIWFSDNGPVLKQVWGVTRDGNNVHTYGTDGSDIFRRMSTAGKSIFRIEDGCGDIEDYWTSGTNLSEEFARLRS